MHKSLKTQWTILFTVCALLIGALACGNGDVPGPEEIALQATRLSLELTQQAIEAGQAEEPAETADVNAMLTEAANQQTQIAQTVPESTAAAPPDVSYESITFSFDKSIAAFVTPSTIPGENGGADMPPWATFPTYYEFFFNGYILANTFHEPKINVYPLSEYQALNPEVGNIVTSLNQVLVTKPTSVESFPFLPFFGAAQFMQANIAYLDFQNGSGVRFLTMYGQAAWPVNNETLFYTFQGITSDGRYYVSVILPVSHPTLPSTSDAAEPDDFIAFSDNFPTYILQTEQTLSAFASDSFLPDLNKLDALVATIAINR